MIDPKSGPKRSGSVHTEPHPSVQDFSHLADLAGAGLETLNHASDTLMRTIAAMGEELTSFTGAQIKANMDAAQSILSSSSPAEAIGRQVEFARSAGQAYLAEATRLFELTVKISQECWTPPPRNRIGPGPRTKTSVN